MHSGRINLQSIPTNIWCRDPPRHISVEPNYPFSVSSFPVRWCGLLILFTLKLFVCYIVNRRYFRPQWFTLFCVDFISFISCACSSSVSMVITRSQSLALFPEEAQRLSSIDLDQSAPPELPTRPVVHRPSFSSVMEKQFMNTLGKEQLKNLAKFGESSSEDASEWLYNRISPMLLRNSFGTIDRPLPIGLLFAPRSSMLINPPSMPRCSS